MVVFALQFRARANLKRRNSIGVWLKSTRRNHRWLYYKTNARVPRQKNGRADAGVGRLHGPSCSSPCPPVAHCELRMPRTRPRRTAALAVQNKPHDRDKKHGVRGGGSGVPTDGHPQPLLRSTATKPSDQALSAVGCGCRSAARAPNAKRGAEPLSCLDHMS